MIVLEERNIKPAVDVIQSLWELACSFYGEIAEPWVNLEKHHSLQMRSSADYFKEQVELKVLGSNPNENKLKAEELTGQYKEAYRKLLDNVIATEITPHKSSSESSVEILEWSKKVGFSKIQDDFPNCKGCDESLSIGGISMGCSKCWTPLCKRVYRTYLRHHFTQTIGAGLFL